MLLAPPGGQQGKKRTGHTALSEQLIKALPGGKIVNSARRPTPTPWCPSAFPDFPLPEFTPTFPNINLHIVFGVLSGIYAGGLTQTIPEPLF